MRCIRWSFFITLGSPNIAMFYIYLYFVKYCINEKLNDYLISLTEKRLSNNLGGIADKMKQFLNSKSRRALQLLLLLLYAVLGGLWFGHIESSQSMEYIYKHHFTKFIEMHVFLIYVTGICYMASIIPETVSRHLQVSL